MKIILYISKKHKYELSWKSELTAAYHFGHKIFNSAPFFFKIDANEAYLQGVSTPALNRLQPVFISPVRCGFYRFFYLKRLNCNRFGLVFFGSVRSGFGLFPVHWTEPSNTTRKAHELALQINQPDLPSHIHRFLFSQHHPDDPFPTRDQDISLTNFDDNISVFHSAIATYYAPSDHSGTYGMHKLQTGDRVHHVMTVFLLKRI